MSNSIINSYKIDPSNFPLTLYRFEYPGVQTTYVSRLEGFKSASNFTPRRLKGLKNAVEFHMDWSCRTASPFISTLSNRRHAHAWARKWSENHNYEQGFVVTIKIEMHHRVTVFRVADLVNRLGITIVGLNPEQYESEYLCFHHIPPESIVKEQSVSYPGMKFKDKIESCGC